jgi:hypothetical protein
MADRCELRWDTQPLGDKPHQISPEDSKKLGISPDEVEVMNRVLKEDRERLINGIRALFIEATGDTANGASLAQESMINEIMDKAPEGEYKRVFQKLSREQAGRAPVPGTVAGSSPLERLMRLLTAAGDGLQASLAKELGPEVAKAYRDLHEGFGSRSRSSPGCPSAQ